VAAERTTGRAEVGAAAGWMQEHPLLLFLLVVLSAATIQGRLDPCTSTI